MTQGRDIHGACKAAPARAAVVVLAVAMLLPFALPAQASARSASALVRDKAAGVVSDAPSAIPTVDLAVAATETGTIGLDGLPVYQYLITLAAGDRLTCTLTADAGTDFDLHLLWPDASSPDDPRVAAAAVGVSYPDAMTFDAAWPGTYQLVVYPVSGAGDFSVSWSITDAGGVTSVERLAGTDRFHTAVRASETMFIAGSSVDVVLASGSSFADSLSAAGLAGALGCPLLLTRPASLPGSVAGELARLKTTDVHIVGGPAAVGAGVEQTLRSAGYEVFRYQGSDRYTTSAVVAAAIDALSPVAPRRAFVARGDDFADALVVSPLAYSQGYPILLTPTGRLHGAAAGAIAASGYEGVIIAGQLSAVSAATERELKALLPAPGSVVRVGGSNRYVTAELIARYAVEHYWALPDWTGIASGTDFPDAVAGGAAIGAQGGVLVLTSPASLSANARSFLVDADGTGLLDHAVLFGGTKAVSAPVEAAVRQVVAP